MHPILFELGPISIRFYGLMYVVAILMAFYIVKREVKRKGIPLTEDQVTNFVIWGVVGGVIIARLYYVVFNASFYMANPLEIPAIWHGGLAIHGGIIGGALGGGLYLRRRSVGFWTMADIMAPTMLLGQSFGRFGNFMNGDAHGAPTDMPWGIVFPYGPASQEFPGMATHPTMLYEIAFNMTFFCFLWFVMRKRDYKDGYLFALYIILYSSGRFVVEIFRADSLMMGPLRTAQVVSIGLILIALACIFIKKLNRPKGA